MTLYRMKYKSPAGPIRYTVVNLETFTTVYLPDDDSFFGHSPNNLHVFFGWHRFTIDRETWNDLKTELAPLAKRSLNRLTSRNEETVPDPTLPSEIDETPHPYAPMNLAMRMAEACAHPPVPPPVVSVPFPDSAGTGISPAHGGGADDRYSIPHPSGSCDLASVGSTTGGPG